MITREVVKQHCFNMRCNIAMFSTTERYHKALDRWLQDYPEDKEKIESLKDDSGLKEWYKAFGMEE